MEYLTLAGASFLIANELKIIIRQKSSMLGGCGVVLLLIERAISLLSFYLDCLDLKSQSCIQSTLVFNDLSGLICVVSNGYGGSLFM